MFLFNDPGNEDDATLGAGAAVSDEVVEAESSLIEQLKSMYTVAENLVKGQRSQVPSCGPKPLLP